MAKVQKTPKFERCIMDVMKTGKDKSAAYGICTASIKGTVKRKRK